jgi:hypothetical protein
MAAPEGNSFWKLRSKHGRDKIFTDPQLLWESACEYFEWCEANPLKEHDFVGKDGDSVHREKVRAFTLDGLCVYLDCDTQTLRNCGIKDEFKDFFAIYTRIYQIIKTQKFEGAAAGIFNASIIARDLGMVDKVEESGTKKVIIEVEYGDGKNKD